MFEKLKSILSRIPKDKALHFCAGFALGFFCVAFAIVAGFAKEELDKRQEGNKFDVSDMLATWIGGVIGQLSSVWLVAHFF